MNGLKRPSHHDLDLLLSRMNKGLAGPTAEAPSTRLEIVHPFSPPAVPFQSRRDRAEGEP